METGHKECKSRVLRSLQTGVSCPDVQGQALCPLQPLESQNHTMVCVGRDLKEHVVLPPTPATGRDTFH